MAKSTEAEPLYCVVIWDDAWGSSEDSTRAIDAIDEHRPLKVETRGWVVVDNENGLSVFAERYLDKGETTYRTRVFIPRLMVRSCTPMKLTTPRKKKTQCSSPSSPSSSPSQ